jgi:hypothetical protein
MTILGYKVQAVYVGKDRIDAEEKFKEVSEALTGKDCAVYVLACHHDDSESIICTTTYSAPRPETQSEKLDRLLRENRARRKAEALPKPPVKLSRKQKKRLARQ